MVVFLCSNDFLARITPCIRVLGTAADNVMTSHGHTDVALKPRLFLHHTLIGSGKKETRRLSLLPLALR